jgi:hypothetical protein
MIGLPPALMSATSRPAWRSRKMNFPWTNWAGRPFAWTMCWTGWMIGNAIQTKLLQWLACWSKQEPTSRVKIGEEGRLCASLNKAERLNMAELSLHFSFALENLETWLSRLWFFRENSSVFYCFFWNCPSVSIFRDLLRIYSMSTKGVFTGNVMYIRICTCPVQGRNVC